MTRISALILLTSLTLSPALCAQPPSSEPNLDQAISLLNEARRQFKDVRDYECRMVRQERVNGKLLPENSAIMKVRNVPFSIYLYCESPKEDEGLEVCYFSGRNDGKMRVHPNGARGVLGFWSIAVNDSRAMEKNRHRIVEAGLGHLLDATAHYWDWERKLNKTEVRITDDEIAGRPCTRIETIHPDPDSGQFYAYRCVLWLDKETHLPAGAEAYDWPRRNGPASGELLETYRFVDLHCNVGLTDKVFAH
jgi:hypothetical protein